MPSYFLVESSYFRVHHGGRDSQGLACTAKNGQTIYLHVIPVAEAELAKLRAKKDDAGNADHTRFALPGRDDWWIAVEGELAWPGIHRPRITSHFVETDRGPAPSPLTEAELDLLRRSGVPGL